MHQHRTASMTELLRNTDQIARAAPSPVAAVSTAEEAAPAKQSLPSGINETTNGETGLD
jgi:hypothetical protein